MTFADAASSNWTFDLEDTRNTRGVMTAHIIFAGRVCDTGECHQVNSFKTRLHSDQPVVVQCHCLSLASRVFYTLKWSSAIDTCHSNCTIEAQDETKIGLENLKIWRTSDRRVLVTCLCH